MQNSELKLRLLAETNQDVFWMSTRGVGEMIYISPAYEKLWGRSQESLYQSPLSFLEIIHPDDRPKCIDIIQKAHKNGQPYEFEYRIVREDGEERWISERGFPVPELWHGKEIMTGVCTDITKRRQTEKALREREQIMRYIIKHDPNAIAVYDRNLHYIAVSDRYLQDYNVKEKNILGKHHYEVFPEMPQRWKEVHQRVLLGATERNDDDYFERPDGSITYNRWEYRPWFTSDGKIGGMITYTEVTTERKKAELALIRSESRLRTLVDTIPDLIWLKDKDGIYISCNKKFERFFGAKESEIVGKTDYDFFDKELADYFCENDRKAMESREPHINEDWLTFAEDGYHGLFESIKTPMHDMDGNLIGILGISRDITERHKSEKEKINLERQLSQAHKMEAIGTLAGGIAHEFNNILGIIIGNTELAIDDVPEWNPAKDCLEEIRTASLRAKEVVRQILSFARKTPTDRKPIQVSTIITEALKMLRATIPTTISIQQKMLCESEMILTSPTEINQVLINLCTNAVHAMEDDTGILDICLEKVRLDVDSIILYEGLKPGDHVKLTVKDTGKGIASEIMDHIFDPYFTTKDVDEGLGMGLAVVYGIVKKYEGDITLKSELGKGTLVEVLFPIIEVEAEAETPESEQLPTGTERILFVDDEEPLVRMAIQILERLGYQVVGKTDSIEALERFRAEPSRFDLVITDMAMPQMAGDRLAQELRKVRSDVPIILCTGHSKHINEERAKELGIKAFTMKPLDKKALANTVREALDGAKGTA